jgi:hypothetical protein
MACTPRHAQSAAHLARPHIAETLRGLARQAWRDELAGQDQTVSIPEQIFQTDSDAETAPDNKARIAPGNITATHGKV